MARPVEKRYPQFVLGGKDRAKRIILKVADWLKIRGEVDSLIQSVDSTRINDADNSTYIDTDEVTNQITVRGATQSTILSQDMTISAGTSGFGTSTITGASLTLNAGGIGGILTLSSVNQAQISAGTGVSISSTANNIILNPFTHVNIANITVAADDAAAGLAGLTTGDLYRTTTGELRIKL